MPDQFPGTGAPDADRPRRVWTGSDVLAGADSATRDRSCGSSSVIPYRACETRPEYGRSGSASQNVAPGPNDSDQPSDSCRGKRAGSHHADRDPAQRVHVVREVEPDVELVQGHLCHRRPRMRGRLVAAVVHAHRLVPCSLTEPLTETDERALTSYAQAQTRVAGQQMTVTYESDESDGSSASERASSLASSTEGADAAAVGQPRLLRRAAGRPPPRRGCWLTTPTRWTSPSCRPCPSWSSSRAGARTSPIPRRRTSSPPS